MKVGLATLAIIMVSAHAGCGGNQQHPQWTTLFAGSTPWQLVKKERQGRRLILVYLTHVEAVTYSRSARNVRDRLQRIKVTETATTVTIGMSQVIQKRDGKVVGTQGVPIEVPVDLEQPLGKRRLVPAPVDSSEFRLDPDRAGDALARISGAGDGACDQSLWKDE